MDTLTYVHTTSYTHTTYTQLHITLTCSLVYVHEHAVLRHEDLHDKRTHIRTHMCMQLHTHTHTHTLTNMHKHRYTRIHTLPLTYTQTCSGTYTRRTSLHTYAHTVVHTQLQTHTYTHIHRICLLVCVSMYSTQTYLT